MTVNGRPVRVLRWNMTTAAVLYLDTLTEDMVSRTLVRR